MSTKEILDVLGIDIKIDKRALHYVYVKNIYINQEYNKSDKDNKSQILQKIGYDLDLSYATVWNSLNRNAVYHNAPEFIKINEAYQSKSRALFDAAVGRMYNVDYEKRNIPKREMSKRNRPIERWHSSKIYEALRMDQDSPLWDVPMPKMTKKHYEIMQRMLEEKK